MLSYHYAFYGLRDELKALYDAQEASAITHEVLLHITGKDKTERLLKKDTKLSHGEQQEYEAMKAELLKGKPLQYVTGIAWFMGSPYKVNEHVLIPRPETEELVQWIVEDRKSKKDKIKILDIGTGSGCIPVALQLLLPNAEVTGCDISNEALIVANENAVTLSAKVTLLQIDILDTVQREQLGQYDVIVSNPPYIPIAEKEHLDINVRDFEPGTALFVPNDDALLFYSAIAEFGKTHLSKNGTIYCELHRDYAEQTKLLFEEMGYTDMLLQKDMHDNLRMLRAK